MIEHSNDWARVAEALDALKAEVAALSSRVAALEASARAEGEAIREEEILVISAAIAAYLGVKPRIRQIRLLRSAGWAQQGRMTIQASHALTRSER